MSHEQATGPQMPRFLTTGQAARLGNWSERFVREHCEDGTIKAAKLGNIWRIDRDALLDQLGIGWEAEDEG